MDNLVSTVCIFEYVKQTKSDSNWQKFDSLVLFTSLVYSYFKKVVTVKCPNWNRKELWGSSSTNNSTLLALTLNIIECRFIIMPRPYSDNLRGPVINHCYSTQSSFRFQYQILTLATFFSNFIVM